MGDMYLLRGLMGILYDFAYYNLMGDILCTVYGG